MFKDCSRDTAVSRRQNCQSQLRHLQLHGAQQGRRPPTHQSGALRRTVRGFQQLFPVEKLQLQFAGGSLSLVCGFLANGNDQVRPCKESSSRLPSLWFKFHSKDSSGDSHQECTRVEQAVCLSFLRIQVSISSTIFVAKVLKKLDSLKIKNKVFYYFKTVKLFGTVVKING